MAAQLVLMAMATRWFVDATLKTVRAVDPHLC